MRMSIRNTIKDFNACVKCVLSYGCETWLVTNELRGKIQTFINRCVRYILRISCPRTISNRELWQLSGQTDINMEIGHENLDGLATH
jgi:hypothetical protein